MTIPNFITILRFLLVPAIIYALLINFWGLACLFFIIAAVSDGIDGFIARHFDQRSELGTYLDPMADKALLSSVFIVLSYMEELPLWLVILVVSRDVLILLAVLLSEVIRNPIEMKPLFISKLTTFAQILLASFILAEHAFIPHFFKINSFLIFLTGILTVLSALAYILIWMRHMTRNNFPTTED